MKQYRCFISSYYEFIIVCDADIDVNQRYQQLDWWNTDDMLLDVDSIIKYYAMGYALVDETKNQEFI